MVSTSFIIDFLGFSLVVFTGCSYWLYRVNDTGLSWREVFMTTREREGN